MGEVMKSNNVIYIATVIISIFVLVSIISIAFFTWPKADDVSLLLQINEKGIFQHIVKSYYSWDGRVISLGIVQSIFLKYLPVEIINIIWASCLILTAFVSLITFLRVLQVGRRLIFSDYIVGTAVISGVFWYGFKNHISDTVYWATGGVYVMALLLATIWLYLWIVIFSPKRRNSRIHIFLFCIYTVFVGALTQNLSCSLLVFMGIELIHSILAKDREAVNKSAILILLLVVGLLIIVIAPGNFIRSTYGRNSFALNFLTLFSNASNIVLYNVRQSVPLFILVIGSIPLMTVFYLYSSAKKIKRRIVVSLGNYDMKTTLKLTRFLFASIASVAPFIFVPDFVSPRGTIYFMAFLFFWIYFDLLPFCLKCIVEHISKRHIQRSYWPFIGIAVFLLGIFSFTSSHILRLRQIKAEVLKREKIIKSYANKGEDVIIYPIDKSKLPFSYTFSDITIDKQNWINQAVAKTYNLKSIRVESIP